MITEEYKEDSSSSLFPIHSVLVEDVRMGRMLVTNGSEQNRTSKQCFVRCDNKRPVS